MSISCKLSKLLVSLAICSSLAGCGGGGGGSAGGTQYTLTPTSVPISIQDKLVTVTVSQGSSELALMDRLRTYAETAWDVILPSAYASQLTPTLTSQATAKVVSGQTILVDPVFSTTVTVPDPNDSSKTIQKTVAVRCDIASIPTTIHVNKAWVLNFTAGDLMVNMDYPASVSADFDPQTETFSSCAFAYESGFFIIYGDGSVSSKLDPTLGGTTTFAPGCNVFTWGEILNVIPAGSPSKNPGSSPILNTLHSTDLDAVDGYQVGTVCGSLTALSYSPAGGQTFTRLTFSNDILPNSTSITVDAAQNVYAIGNDRSYGGNAMNTACPVSTMKIGDATSTCLSVPNLTNFVDHPVSAAQLQAAGRYGPYVTRESIAALFIGQGGLPILSLQPSTSLCNISGCNGAEKPSLFTIDIDTSTIAALATPALDAAGYPFGSIGTPTPFEMINGYLMFSNGGPPSSGVLVNISTGNVIHTCSNMVFGQDHGCNVAHAFGDHVYGFVGCAYQGGDPNTCVNSPTVDRVNTLTGVAEHWDIKALGYLAVNGISNSTNTMSLPTRPIFFTDQVVFLACPSPNLACASPNWVALSFATGQITPVTTNGITFDMIASLIGTALW